MQKIKLRNQKSGRCVGWLLSAVLALVVVGYAMLYFNNTYPISEGWGINYVEMMFRGKMPYRDFYYYLPPLNLLLDAIFWKLSFGLLLAFRGWYLLQRVTIYMLLFRLLRKYFNQYGAFAACVLTSIIATGDVYDLIGDYNQTMALLTVLLLWCAHFFAHSGDRRVKLRALGAAGFVIGCMFLNKQTIFAACFITFFAVLSVLCLIRRDKDYWRYCLSVACGVIVPVAAALIWLGVNGALVPFFEQVFLNVDGKGSLLYILLESITGRLWQPRYWSLILIFTALVMFEKESRADWKTSAVLLLGLLFLGYSGFFYTEMQCMKSIVVKYRSALAVLFVGTAVCGALAVLSWKNDRRLEEKRWQLDAVAAVGIMLCLCAMGAACLHAESFARDVHFNGLIFNLIQGCVSDLLFFAMLLLMLVLLIRIYRFKAETLLTQRYEGILFMACGAFALMYAGVMASGNSPAAAHVLRISLPLALCVIFNVKLEHRWIARIMKGSVAAVCVMLCLGCMAQKITCSYSWWGSYMAPRSEKTESVDIPAMAGMRVSADQKELYETVTRAIEEYTDEDAVVWGYPHIKLFNILTERYTSYTFVPVLFYDVAADVYVEQEAALLAENLPDAVVWEDIPGCLETHETVFRDGEPLKQRLIIELFDTLLPESYTEVARVGDVIVYIRNDHVNNAEHK